MQRLVPNVSTQVSMKGRQARASSLDVAGFVRVSKPKPKTVMPMPPTFTHTLGRAASARRSFFHCARTSSRFGSELRNPDGRADMVQDDGRVREGVREFDELAELRVVEPGIEAESESIELREALPERGSDMRCGFGRSLMKRAHRSLVGRRSVTHATQAPPARLHLLVQDLGNAIAEREVGVRNDACGRPDMRRAVVRMGDPVRPTIISTSPTGRMASGPVLSPSGFVGLDIDGADDSLAARGDVSLKSSRR